MHGRALFEQSMRDPPERVLVVLSALSQLPCQLPSESVGTDHKSPMTNRWYEIARSWR